MPELSTLNSDLRVLGHLTANTMSIPAASVSNSSVKADAALDASKLVHEHRGRIAQGIAANAAAQSEVVHVARAAGTLEQFVVGLVTPPDTASGSSGRTATFDLKKNGTTVLSATVVLDSTNVAYVVEAATISVSAYVAGDVFTVIITVGGSVGTHALGVFAEALFHEQPA
jgi:hypothetical protein